MASTAAKAPAQAKEAKASPEPSREAQPAARARPSGQGAALPPSTRMRMERSFGRSFDDVRVHDGSDAAAAARTHGAEAFTVGRDISFGAGAYRPGSESGDRLIAHELAHVVQQEGTGQPAVQTRSLDSSQQSSDPAEPAEQQADAAASRVMRGEPAGVTPVLTTRHRLMRKALAGAMPAAPFTAPSLESAVDAAGPQIEDSESRGGDGAPRRKKRRPPDFQASAKEADEDRAQQAEETRAEEPAERAPEEPVQAEAAKRKEAAAEAPAAQEPKREANKAARVPARAMATRLLAARPMLGRFSVPGRPAPTSTVPEATGAGKAAEPVKKPADAAAAAPSEAAGKDKEATGKDKAAAGKDKAATGKDKEATGKDKGASAEAKKEDAAPEAKVAKVQPAAGAPKAGAAAPATRAAAPDSAGGGGGGGGGGPGMAGGEASADSSGGAATEEAMDAAQPEEEAAAEAMQEGELEEAAPLATEEEPAAAATEESAAERADAMSEPGSEAAVPEPRESEEDKQVREADSAQPAGPAAPEAASPEDAALSPAEQEAAMASISEGGGAEPGGGGGGGGGGAIPDKPEPAVPDVSQAEPADALGQLSGLPPAQLVQALSGVSQAATRSVGDKRSELAANPPSLDTPTGMPGKSAPRQDAAAAAADTKKADKIPQGESTPTPQPEPTPAPPPSPAAAIAAPPIRGGEKDEMSKDEAELMGRSIHDMPTSDPELSTSAGEAPTLALEGGADPGQLSTQQAEIDGRVAEAQAQGQRDAAEPMGEDEIAPRQAEGTLEATISGEGGGAGGGAAGGEVDKATSIVAEEEHGAEIQAAVEQGQGDISAEEASHAETEEAERQATREETDRQIEQAAEEQRAEKQGARADVAAKRGEWTEAQRAAVADGRTKADEESKKAHEKVETEKTQAETDAAGHIEHGEAEAERAKSEGEAEAETHKERGKRESSGFFGWLASKAKRFFNAIKEGIKAAIKKAREAVKRAIDAAKKLAREAIELARKAVVAAIRAAGEALMAIGDVVLAAFPEARAKFRAAIKEAVDAAEAAVNRIADALQKGIQKLLDLLGAALDKALGLLEKGLLAIVDAVGEAVQAAIKAAKAVVDALGTFAVLIADIAAGPGQWISNLGASVVDGIKNHLWKALKKAISDWFNQKVESVLGLGKAIYNLLVKGGLTLEKIGKMAWEALKAAIPPALIQILVEKLVAMIVPAAGAVMAIIEGLQAAWGTVSRILAAIDMFITFLKAVKGGGAGPQFANAVAAGAVAVIDFVSNWLLLKLGKAAGKVAGKLKAIAQKIGKKIGKALKKVGKALKKAWNKAKKKRRKGRQRKDNQKRKDDKASLEDKKRRVRAAVAEVAALPRSRKGEGGPILRQAIPQIKRKHKLRTLSVTPLSAGDETYRVFASINPSHKGTVSFESKEQMEANAKAMGAALVGAIGAIKGDETTSRQRARQEARRAGQSVDVAPKLISWSRLDRNPSTKAARWNLNLKGKVKGKMIQVRVGTHFHGIHYIRLTAAEGQVPKGSGQTIYKDLKGGHFVDDSLGQKTPRYASRAVTKGEGATFKSGKPVGEIKPPGGSITEYQHVSGAPRSKDLAAGEIHKQTPFSSTSSAVRGDVVDPHNDSFNQHGKVLIDLSKVPSSEITNMSTEKAIKDKILNQGNNKKSVLDVIKHDPKIKAFLNRGEDPPLLEMVRALVRVKKAGGKAGKPGQAVLDVIRTDEVLVKKTMTRKNAIISDKTEPGASLPEDTLKKQPGIESSPHGDKQPGQEDQDLETRQKKAEEEAQSNTFKPA